MKQSESVLLFCGLEGVDEHLLVASVGFAYESLHKVALHGALEEALRHTNHHLCERFVCVAILGHEHHTQRKGRHRLCSASFEEAVDELLAVYALTLWELL